MPFFSRVRVAPRSCSGADRACGFNFGSHCADRPTNRQPRIVLQTRKTEDNLRAVCRGGWICIARLGSKRSAASRRGCDQSRCDRSDGALSRNVIRNHYCDEALATSGRNHGSGSPVTARLPRYRSQASSVRSVACDLVQLHRRRRYSLGDSESTEQGCFHLTRVSWRLL